LIHFHSIKHLEQGQAQLRARSCPSEPAVKVNFWIFHLFDSHSILHYSCWFLVVWSPINVGNKIELL
jgi:hypothetical protein